MCERCKTLEQALRTMVEQWHAEIEEARKDYVFHGPGKPHGIRALRTIGAISRCADELSALVRRVKEKTDV